MSSGIVLTLFPSEELNNWLNGFKYSRPLKNKPKDFSDGLLIAEVISQVKPGSINLAYYKPANSIIKKKDNWDLLKSHILKKLKINLDSTKIQELAEGNLNTIEKLIMEICEKLDVKFIPKTASVNELNSGLATEGNDLIDEQAKQITALEKANKAIVATVKMYEILINEKMEKLKKLNGEAVEAKNCIKKVQGKGWSLW